MDMMKEMAAKMVLSLVMESLKYTPKETAIKFSKNILSKEYAEEEKAYTEVVLEAFAVICPFYADALKAEMLLLAVDKKEV